MLQLGACTPDPAPAPTLTAFTLKATGIDGLSEDVPADIDEASRTIMLSINADPTKRATWTSVSTNQITTTYTGASVTPSATTLNLSNDNTNVATYTVTNSDGKTKVYTLKIEFVAFKIKLDWQAPSTVSQYKVRVFQLFDQVPETLNVPAGMLLKPFADVTLTKPNDGVLKYAGYIAPQNIYVLVESMDASSTIIKALTKTGGDMSSIISLNNKAIQVAFTSFTFALIEAPFEILNLPTDWTPYGNVPVIDVRKNPTSYFLDIYAFNIPSEDNQNYLRSHSRLYFFTRTSSAAALYGEWRARIYFKDFRTASIMSNIVSPPSTSWSLGDINKLSLISLNFNR